MMNPMKFKQLFILLIIFAFQTPIWANEAGNESGDDNSTEPQKKPDQDEEDPLSGAEVTITKTKDRVIEAYKINGRIVQVKITPKNGYPYYLIDTDGDGTFDVRSSEAWKRTTVNTWKIYQW